MNESAKAGRANSGANQIRFTIRLSRPKSIKNEDPMAEMKTNMSTIASSISGPTYFFRGMSVVKLRPRSNTANTSSKTTEIAYDRLTHQPQKLQQHYIFRLIPLLRKVSRISGDQILCSCSLRTFQRDVVIWIDTRANSLNWLYPKRCLSHHTEHAMNLSVTSHKFRATQHIVILRKDLATNAQLHLLLF